MRKYHGKDLSTNDFTDGYKKRIDSMQTLYRFKGTVDTVDDLSSIEDRNIGDTYKCKANSNTYIWNGIEWINAGQDVDYSEILEQIDTYQNEVNTQINNIEQEGIIVSPTEPTENRRKVWMQKGKNLFNSSFEIAQIHGVTGNNESSTDVITSNGYTEVKSNVQYTISTNKYNGVSRVAFYDKNKSLIQVIYNTATFTTPDNAKYIRFSIWSSTTINQIDSDLKVQVEQGSTAADYEEYIEPKTYILNDNNVYEEFMKKHEEIYSTEEQVIGKWVNNKPIYRKCFSGTFESDQIVLTNVDLMLNVTGTAIINSVGRILPYYEIYNNQKYFFLLNKTPSNEVSIQCMAEDTIIATNANFYVEYTKTTD